MKTVLVVDDEQDMVGTLAAILADEGYQVRKAFDGREALQIIESDAPDLILLDIMMPFMSGLELMEIIQSDQRYAKIPVVGMSGFPPGGRLREIGFAGFIQKPFDLDSFIGLIHEQFHD